MREMKVLLKRQNFLNPEIRYDLQFEHQMVIDLDKDPEINEIKIRDKNQKKPQLE